MEIDDIGALFGDEEAERVGDSGPEESGGEDEHQERPADGDAEEQDGNEAAAAAEGAGTGKTIQYKKVVRNPQPKLDAHRLAGPRGMFALKKTFRDFKFKGKGHEREDLRNVLKRLEHWAHRLFPKLRFLDTLEQIEKLGAQKSVQVNLKKLRLDMFTEEGSEEGEDNVRRGTDDAGTEEQMPAVDVFDELLGITTTAATATTTTTAATTTASVGGGMSSQVEALSPPKTSWSPPRTATPSQKNVMSDEQRERMERNRRLAIEKRLARQQELEQQQQQQDSSASQNSQGKVEEHQEEEKLASDSELMDDADDVFTSYIEQEEKRETQESLEGTQKNSDPAQRQKKEISDERKESIDDFNNVLENAKERREMEEDSEEELVIDDVLEKIQDSVDAQNKLLNKAGEHMDNGNGLDKPEELEKKQQTEENSEELAINDILETFEGSVNETKTPDGANKHINTIDDNLDILKQQQERLGLEENSEEELTTENILPNIQSPVSDDKKIQENTVEFMAVLNNQNQEKMADMEKNSQEELAIANGLEEMEDSTSSKEKNKSQEDRDEFMEVA